MAISCEPLFCNCNVLKNTLMSLMTLTHSWNCFLIKNILRKKNGQNVLKLCFDSFSHCIELDYNHIVKAILIFLWSSSKTLQGISGQICSFLLLENHTYFDIMLKCTAKNDFKWLRPTVAIETVQDGRQTNNFGDY